MGFFSFPTCMLFIFSSCLAVLAGTFSSINMLNESGQSGYPWLTPYLSREVLSFTIEYNMMLAVGFCRCSLSSCESSLFLVSWQFGFFNLEWVLNFVRFFSCSNWHDHGFSSLSFWYSGLQRFISRCWTSLAYLE